MHSTVINNNINMDNRRARALLIQNFADQLKCIAREKSRVLPLKLQPHVLI